MLMETADHRRPRFRGQTQWSNILHTMHGACQFCEVQTYANILHRQGNPYGQNIVVFVIDV
jgi:hypothetical protein